jgi:hypothetical protein
MITRSAGHKTARHTGEVAASGTQKLDALHRAPQQRLDAHKAFAAAIVVELEDLVLGEVQQFRDISGALVPFADERRGGLN